MNKTKIEWVKNPDGTQGYTWNPITGCLNHINGMCKGGNFPCYAYRLAHGRLRERYLANCNYATAPSSDYFDLNPYIPTDPFYPRFWPERLAELQRGIDSPDYQTYIRRKGMGIFVCDMSDLFGVGIPERWTAEILETIGDDSNSMHHFYLLTKQPQNLPKFSPFPDNCWVGVTATNDHYFALATEYMQRIEAKVKFISFQPLLGDIEATRWGMGLFSIYNWLIIGAQTKPYKPPKIEWVEEIIQASRKANIPIFLKNNLEPVIENRKLIQEIPC